MQVLNRISSKTVFGKIYNVTEPRLVMRVVGIVKGFKTGETNLGEFVKFIGEFKATNLETGEQYFSGVAFFPGAGENLVYGAISGSPEGSSVNIAFDFAVIPADTPTGYEWRVHPLIEEDSTTPLALLESSLSNAHALPAPKAKAKK